MDRPGTRIGSAMCLAATLVAAGLALLLLSLLPGALPLQGVLTPSPELLPTWGAAFAAAGVALFAVTMLVAYLQARGTRRADPAAPEGARDPSGRGCPCAPPLLADGELR